jgi:hypothetical protein
MNRERAANGKEAFIRTRSEPLCDRLRNPFTTTSTQGILARRSKAMEPRAEPCAEQNLFTLRFTGFEIFCNAKLKSPKEQVNEQSDPKRS